MSIWGSIDASFEGDQLQLSEDDLRRGMPTGSEEGPRAHVDGHNVWVDGRLRDVTDMADSPAVLAWFASVCEGFGRVDHAELMWEIDGGPRYRWQFDSNGLRRLRGVLD